jgi:hypothetical protein
MPYNQLLDEHSLADTGTAEETNFTSTCVGSEEIDDLDAGDQDFSARRLLNELWWIGVDGEPLGALDGATLVNGITGDVHDATESAGADGNHDGVASVGRDSASDETLGTWMDVLVAGGGRGIERVSYRPWQCSGRHSVPNVAVKGLANAS